MSPTNFVRYLLTMFALVAVGQMCAAQTQPRPPQDGVLLLKHGTTLSGFITKVGNRYVVLLGDSGEARVPEADVLAVVSNLQEAYQFKRSQLSDSLASRIELAQWCLANGLPARAADQILAAERSFGRHPQLESLHQRLLAVAKAKTLIAGEDSSVAKVSFDEPLELPSSEAIDSFTSTVQPLLLNRCASGGCHNNRGTSEYVLFRPFYGQATTRRLTERNLTATLAYVNRKSPLDSVLLSKAGSAHGGSESAALDGREQKQLDALAEWLRGFGSGRRQIQPTTIKPARELLYQPDRLPEHEQEVPMNALPAARQSTRIADPVEDPFDPAVFNQLHHARTK